MFPNELTDIIDSKSLAEVFENDWTILLELEVRWEAISDDEETKKFRNCVKLFQMKRSRQFEK